MSVTGKDLIKMGYPQGRVIGIALKSGTPNREGTLEDLFQVLQNPEEWIADGMYGDVARELVSLRAPAPEMYDIREDNSYPVWGNDLIGENTHEQMRQAMSLPVSVGGALMPDAHLGYGLPVGGVLATEGVVIPWAVGVDISCSMRLSVFPLSSHVIGQQRGRLREILLRSTNFGSGGRYKEGRRGMDHPVLEDPAWAATSFLKGLQNVAHAQLGTSGSGNHFVEWGIYEEGGFADGENFYSYGGPRLAILSHSGSRGVGFKIANKYSKIAKKKHDGLLPEELENLSWLDLTSEEGIEYWLSMELSQRFAQANHEVIHAKMAQALGTEPNLEIFNSHNLAWRERHNEKDVIVHRKGATPAARGELGIIPGSMGTPGYVVEGKGNAQSLNSASHGAGRTMSRTQAFKTLSEEDWKRHLKDEGIDLLAAGLDEAPGAYKPIDEVIAQQQDLVKVKGKFTPRIVRMDDGSGRRR